MNTGVREGRAGRFWADDALLEQPISGIAKMTYIVLCRYASRDGTSYPALETLAGAAGFSLRAVQRALDELSKAALVAVESGKKTGRPNVYTVLGCASGGRPHSPTGWPASPTPSASQSIPGLAHQSNEGSTAGDKEGVRRKDTGALNPNRRIAFDATTARIEGVDAEDRARWRELYPAVDLDRAILECADWLRRNPHKQGPRIADRLTNWIKNEQERAGRRPGVQTNARGNGTAAALQASLARTAAMEHA